MGSLCLGGYKKWILDWLEKVTSEILRFSTMYGTLDTFIGQNQAQIFRALCIKKVSFPPPTTITSCKYNAADSRRYMPIYANLCCRRRQTTSLTTSICARVPRFAGIWCAAATLAVVVDHGHVM